MLIPLSSPIGLLCRLGSQRNNTNAMLRLQTYLQTLTIKKYQSLLSMVWQDHLYLFRLFSFQRNFFLLLVKSFWNIKTIQLWILREMEPELVCSKSWLFCPDCEFVFWYLYRCHYKNKQANLSSRANSSNFCDWYQNW